MGYPISDFALEISVLDKGYVRYVDHYGSDLRIVEAARVSYDSPSKGPIADKNLLFYLYRNRHTSPFEQCAITFNIKLPLFVQAQIVRHRTQKLNQKSARYVEMVEEFYIPSAWRKQSKKNKQCSEEVSENWNPWITIKPTESEKENGWDEDWNSTATDEVKDFCSKSYNLYKSLLEAGVAREMARMILPQNLYTEIYTTWDLHNLMHFFTLREHEHAQAETREYAKAMMEITRRYFPWTMEAFDKYKFIVTEAPNQKV